MVKKAKKLNRFVNILNVIPDTTEILRETVQAAAPIVDKALEHNREKSKNVLQVPNVLDLDVTEAREHLETMGFRVTATLVKPDKKYSNSRAQEVVDMHPKPGKAEKGSLVKLYYITQEVIDECNTALAISNLIGLSLPEAQELLQNLGLKAVTEVLKAEVRFAKQKTNTVIDMDPKANLLGSTVVKGSIIRLKYLDQETLDESKALAELAAKNQFDLGQFVKQLPNVLPQNKQE